MEKPACMKWIVIFAFPIFTYKTSGSGPRPRNGKQDTAVKLVDRCFEAMPETLLPMHLRLKAAAADVYYRCGNVEKGDQIVSEVGDEAADLVIYFKKFKTRGLKSVSQERDENLDILRDIAPMARQFQREDIAKKYEALFNQLSTGY